MDDIYGLSGKKLGVEMSREEPLRLYWGEKCGRCESAHTFKELYTSKREPEYWCRYCGTELKSDGSVMFLRGAVAV